MTELKTIKNALEMLQASPNAITFYLTSYRLGRRAIGQVAKEAQMDRSSAYLAFEQLKQLGVMEEEAVSGCKIVVAKPPQATVARLRTEIRRFRREVGGIEGAMPVLSAAYAAASERPVLQVFTGKDGLHRIMDDVLIQTSDEILLFSNFDEEKKVFDQKDHDDFIKRRVEAEIRLRLIATDSKQARTLQVEDQHCLRQTRIIKDDQAFKSETYIYGDAIAMLSFDERSGIVGFIIRSKDFARTERWLFEQTWATLSEK